jgi:hypothetical protein
VVLAGCGGITSGSSAPIPGPGLTLVSGGTFDEVGGMSNQILQIRSQDVFKQQELD